MDEFRQNSPPGWGVSGDTGGDRRAAAPHGAGVASDVVERVPPAAVTHSRADRGGTRPLLTVPGLVMLATVAIFEGYQWLHLIPGESLHPSGLLFAVVSLPATYWLTRCGNPGHTVVLRRTTRACAAAIPVLGLIVLIGYPTPWARALGLVPLALAASALGLAVASERADSSPSHQR